MHAVVGGCSECSPPSFFASLPSQQRHQPGCQHAPDELPRTPPRRSDSADEEAAGDVDADQPSDAPGEEDAPSGSPKRRKGVSGSQQQELKAVLAALTAQAQERVALVEERAKNEQLVQALQEVG